MLAMLKPHPCTLGVQQRKGLERQARSLTPPWEIKALLNLSQDICSTRKKSKAEESFPLDRSHSTSLSELKS